MSDITIVLPFGLPPAELAPDLLRALELPALAMLLARSDPTPLVGSKAARRAGIIAEPSDAFARALPHETWLAQRFDLHAATGSSPAVAIALMATQMGAPPEGFWFIVTPVHFHVARDHLVLTDLRALALTDTDAEELFAAALPSFEEAGLTLRFGRADCWFVRADDWRALVTATPDATCGHNIDIWMPQGATARAWRKLQNAVQMDWHDHAVNAARAADGLQTINSLWLWGGADAASLPSPRADLAIAGFDGWFSAMTACTAKTVSADDLPGLFDAKPRSLLLKDSLIAPALANDWATWLDDLRIIEQDCFVPLLSALRDGVLDSLQVVLGNATSLDAWTVRRSSLRRFWRKPSLTRLRTRTASAGETA